MNNVKVYSGTISGPYKDPNRVNQDSSAYLQENGYTVIAVADGAGSLKNSHIGSNLAANTAVNEVMDALISGAQIDEAIKLGIDSARTTLLERDDRKDVGCTLVIGAILENIWGIGIVGDSYAVITLEDGEHTVIEREPDSEFVNFTKLITSTEYDPFIIVKDEPIKAMTVTTDGLHHSSVQQGKATQGFWNPLITMCSEGNIVLDDFLEYMNSMDKINDDTTLVVAVKS